MFYSIYDERNHYESRLYGSYEEAEAHLDEFCADLAGLGYSVDPNFIFVDRAD